MESQEDDASVITSCSGDSRLLIRPTILQALADEIESNGGLQVFLDCKEHKLSKLLDKDEGTFGKKGDPLRRQLQLKVLYWKRLFKKGHYATRVLYFVDR